MKAQIKLSSPIVQTPRVLQCAGMFDVPAAERSEVVIEVDMPIEEKEWNIGLVVGPSGCGKSSVARHLWAKELSRPMPWPKGKSVLDAFPASMSIKDVVQLMSSVGFSSPPAWVRPFQALSNGEQFRVTLARLLAELPKLAVIDEFTSVVDRTVAQVGSAALAKTVRRRKQKLVAVTCHDDVESWLQPDWVYRPAEQRFTWRSLQRRPAIEFEIVRCGKEIWPLFASHHYLSADLHRAARCFVGLVDGRPIAFGALMHFPHPKTQNMTKLHRLVVLPDFQGLGAGGVLADALGGITRAMGRRLGVTTSHPSLIRAWAKSTTWTMTRPPSLASRLSSSSSSVGIRSTATNRMTASFEYRGQAAAQAVARKMWGA